MNSTANTILLLGGLGLGGFLLYQWLQSQQVTVPAAVASGLANPAAARDASFLNPASLPLSLPASGPTSIPGVSWMGL